MNEYVGKICPFCKTELKEDDDIVVCSACEIPHHKDCWIENQGCTTFGCTGTIKSVDGSDAAIDNNSEAATTSEFVFCTNCGSKNSGISSFCSQCGTKLVNPVNNASQLAVAPAPVQQPAVATAQPIAQAVAYAPQPTQEPTIPNQQAVYAQQPATYNQTTYPNHQQPAAYANYQQPALPANNMYMPAQPQFNVTFEPELVQMIGENSQYYLNQFSKIKMANRKETWNWAAFFLAPYWMIYRKMYSYGIACMVISYVLNLLGPYGRMAQIGLWVCAGIYANFVYLLYLETKVNESRSMIEPMKSQFLANEGNTNVGAAIAAAILYVMIPHFGF